MTINLEEMKEIAKRLPIGFYLGRKTPVIVELGDRAYCDTVKGDIHLGVGVLQLAAGQIDASDAAEWDRETLLRCLLYHEIGHLLLSSKDLKNLYLELPEELTDHRSNIINIFEDERIESLLASAFMGVDFKKFVRLIHKQGVKDGDMLSKIFKAIRLRETTAQISDAIDDAIKDLRGLNIHTTRWNSHLPGAFAKRLSKIINMILEQEKEQEKDSNNSDKSEQSSDKSEQNELEDSQEEQDGGQGNANNPNEDEDKDESDDDDSAESEGDGNDSGEDEEPDEDSDSSGNGGGNEDDSEDDSEGDSNANNGGNGEDESEEDGGSAPSPNENEESDGEGEDEPEESEEDESTSPSENESKSEDGSHNSCGKKIELPEDYLRSLAASVFSTPPPNVAKTLNKFASRLAKKKGNRAAGIWSGLHGKIDNKRDAMGKDKIFRRKSDVGDSLMDSVNLNLWVDISGSFEESKDELNNILAAVSRALQMAGSKLKVNVIHAGECATVVPSDSWAVDPRTDNAINETYVYAWKKTRDKTRRNIDIVVFDGVCGYGAHLMNRGRIHPQIPVEIEIAKQIWDNRDCWIVCDNENRRFFTESVPKAHVTYIGEDYAQHLQSKVIEILDRIL